MNAGQQLAQRLAGIANGRSLHTTLAYVDGCWLVDIRVLSPDCPSEFIYSATGENEQLETAITLAAQALAEKEHHYDTPTPKPRPRHIPGNNYAWAYQLVVQPDHS